MSHFATSYVSRFSLSWHLIAPQTPLSCLTLLTDSLRVRQHVRFLIWFNVRLIVDLLCGYWFLLLGYWFFNFYCDLWLFIYCEVGLLISRFWLWLLIFWYVDNFVVNLLFYCYCWIFFICYCWFVRLLDVDFLIYCCKYQRLLLTGWNCKNSSPIFKSRSLKTSF
jgi:hypothetical protein